MYESRTMKPVEIVLRRGEEMRENDGGVNTIYCKHICKCHNESLLYNYYMLINTNIIHENFKRSL
jgi:hypothetical protein